MTLGGHGVYSSGEMTVMSNALGLLAHGDLVVFLGDHATNQARVTTWKVLTHLGIGWIVVPICDPCQ